MAASRSSHKVVYAAIAGNLLVAVTKFVAAAVTGSSAMLSEGVHSLVDTVNQVLLLYGMHRARRPADEEHPLGHGRELYFWSFIVALLIFSLGAGISFYEGVLHVRHPEPMTRPWVSFVVFGLSAVFEGSSWWVAFSEFNAVRGRVPLWLAVTRSKDPTGFVVLFEDSAALIGIAIAAAGTAAAVAFEQPVFDGVASIGIGCVLAITAVVLARESKGLLLGEPAYERVRRSILRIARDDPAICDARNLFTVHLAPDQIVAALDVDFDDDLRASEVERIASDLEGRIRKAHPEVIALFLKPKATPR